MHASPCAAHAHRVLQMQHLMVEQVFNRVTGTRRPVENSTHHNCVVRRIVVTKQSLCVMLAPGQLRPSQKSMEETLVQRVENLFEIVVPPLGSADSLRSPRMANLFCLSCYYFAVLKALIAMIVCGTDWFLIYLRDQNMGDCAQHRFRRTLQKIRETHVQLAVSQPDSRVQRDESPKSDMERRHRCARPQRPVLLLKDGNNVLSHQFGD